MCEDYAIIAPGEGIDCFVILPRQTNFTNLNGLPPKITNYVCGFNSKTLVYKETSFLLEPHGESGRFIVINGKLNPHD